jgi:hypothetical protein
VVGGAAYCPRALRDLGRLRRVCRINWTTQPPRMGESPMVTTIRQDSAHQKLPTGACKISGRSPRVAWSGG